MVAVGSGKCFEEQEAGAHGWIDEFEGGSKTSRCLVQHHPSLVQGWNLATTKHRKTKP
jgi:hypothetical protein